MEPATETEGEQPTVSKEAHDHFCGAYWAVQTAMAHLVLIDEPDLGYEPNMVWHELQPVLEYLKCGFRYPVKKEPVCPF